MFNGIGKDSSKALEVCLQIDVLRQLSVGGCHFLQLLQSFASALARSSLYVDADACRSCFSLQVRRGACRVIGHRGNAQVRVSLLFAAFHPWIALLRLSLVTSYKALEKGVLYFVSGGESAWDR